MFDIGGFELMLIAIVGLLVIGPKRLPETLRTMGLWMGRIRRSFSTVKSEIEKEIGMDEIRRQLHNEAVMEEMKHIERQVKGSVDGAAADQSDSNSDHATDSTHQEAAQTVVPEPTPPPRSEAELEAAHAAKHKIDERG
ncbi:MAG: twin-arginine translocase subunit TatB [Gammaproteobacteria bacterium]|nr:twin-arginine translocase subunit TatB [Gammaproteobacteria bacterium]